MKFTLLRYVLAAALVVIVSPAQSRVDPRLTGEWSGSIPGLPTKLVLQFESFGLCPIAGEAGTCQTSGDVLLVSLAAGGQTRYTYRVEGDRLTLSGGAFAAPVVLQRSTSQAILSAASHVELQFAGMTPGLAGLLQFNLKIPDNAATGANVPLLLWVNGVAAQAYIGGAVTTKLVIAIQ